MYTLTSGKLDAERQHWVAALANYNFQLHHKTGKLNVEADTMAKGPI